MKNLLPLSLWFGAVALCAGTMAAHGGYVTPRIPPTPLNAAAKSGTELRNTPNGLTTIWSVTSVNDAGPGSLREAISSAASGDSINFTLPLPAVIVLSNTLVIDKDLGILGPGADELTVMRSDSPGTPEFRVFDVQAGVVAISGITIRNGVAYSGTHIHDNLGGGILNQGTLTVTDCVITGNVAPTTDWGTNVTPSVSIGFGAGIFSYPGSELTIANTTISGNHASAAGGAVCTWYANLCVATGSTFSGNSAEMQGGGLNLQGLSGNLENCTLSGNSTPPDGPGSAYLLVIWPGETATLKLTACTISGNTGSTNGACTIASVYGNPGITNKLLSTLVADNEGPNFFLDGNPVLVSLGHNLDSDGTSGLVNGDNGDLVGTAADPLDAMLGPLQDNGGHTFTIPLLPGSPALDSGSCQDAGGAPLVVDQRGFTRPQGGGCDIGAYESQPLNLICPPGVVVEFMSRTGAVASYSVTVTSVCPQVTTVSSPASGSLFPIGVTPVQVQATDSCSNSAQCSFTVTVLGAFGVKSNVLAELTALRASLDLNPLLAWKFDLAIDHLAKSLNPAYWIDQTHLQPRKGNIAMHEEMLAVILLEWIMALPHCPVDPGVLQDFINRIVKCDRLLAVICIEDAANAGLHPKKIAEDLAMVARGDRAAARGHFAVAIEHYRNAWRHALMLRLRCFPNPNGTTRVEFQGNNCKSYLIERSTDMANWVVAGSCVADAEGNVVFTDPSPPQQQLRFYRAAEQ
ncbi:MAG TPA: choice-of-anchor Q domain-containing protein [Candidatus Paceibacterota bacterium]|nr:choice-of-anchor Q domain-containing protein [Verrucomicrobiota bacterium]HSA11523.1 choice-of-anchor Q domain-containing protein [Candidatus Paceibacterota bacterium]